MYIYQQGRQVALAHLGLKTAAANLPIKEANVAQLAAQYARPAAAGAGFGGGAGYLYAPEGQKMEGALTGAGLGAAGAVGGKAVMQGLNKGRMGMARNNISHLEGQMPKQMPLFPSAEQQQLFSKLDDAKGALGKMPANAPKDEVGGAMLGAVTGTAGAMNKTENVAGQRPYSQRVDPYGYSRR